jgi:hypothetical protein
MTKEQHVEYKADVMLQFIQEYGRLPKGNEEYNGVKLGRFLSAARQSRSKLAMEALAKRGIDFSVGTRSYMRQLNLTQAINTINND